VTARSRRGPRARVYVHPPYLGCCGCAVPLLLGAVAAVVLALMLA
jgi:hypothetical protein